MLRPLTISTLLAAFFLPAPWCRLIAADPTQKDIVETAIAAEFKTLIKAVQAAGLVDMLKGNCPFTVFAPTDKAFAAIPKDKLQALLEDKKALTAVLTYHVVPGKVVAADVVKLDEAKTVQGQKVRIEAEGGKVQINAANVVKADIACTNGVIHVIDAVLLPPTPRADAAKVIDDALAANEKDAEQSALALEAAAEQVLKLVPDNALVQKTLQSVSTANGSAPHSDSKIARLRGALSDAAEILRFEPTIEAEAPDGFPQPTPVGEIEIKRYPAYRLARAEIGDTASEESAFFTLFRHITANQIAMTAPVEMTYDATWEQDLRPREMAFLYSSPRLGKTGKQAEVNIADIPAMTVASIGMRGDHSHSQVTQAHALLKRWLNVHKDLYRASGPVRVMGHNSPMVPVSRRYFEVQIPVEMKDRAGESRQSG